MKLYAHPFSSYCQKVLIALYENDTPVRAPHARAGRPAGGGRARGPVAAQAHAACSSTTGRTVMEASIIIEHLDLHHPGPVRLIPEDPRAALEVRMMDRFFDNYVMTPMQKIVFDSIRAARAARSARRRRGAGAARHGLSLARRRDGRARVGGRRRLQPRRLRRRAVRCSTPTGSHPIGEAFANVRAYRRRLLARPSFARAVDEARPYRPLFPLGAPDRD